MMPRIERLYQAEQYDDAIHFLRQLDDTLAD
jgi:hypothetical protein